MVAMAGKKKRTGGGRAYHSVLEPYQERIQQLRRQRLTWKEIADRLATECGVRVTLHAVYRFCRRRVRRSPSWEEALALRQPQTIPGGPPTEPDNPGPTVPSDETTVPRAPEVTGRRPYLPVSNFRRPDTKSFKKEDYL